MKLRQLLPRQYTRNFSGYRGILLMLVILIISSCKKENNNSQYAIPSDLTLIGSGYASGAATKVEIYTTQEPFVGYNKVYIALYDSVSGQRITQTQVSLSALMTNAGTGNLSAPVENPPFTYAADGLFSGALVFVSATSVSVSWTVDVHIQNGTNNAPGDMVIPVSITQPNPVRSYTVTTPGGSSLFVSIVQPLSPQLGVNDFELTVHKLVNNTYYVPDSTYMVAINPSMPSMTGMGSPNNVNPVYTANGHYAGKVDFIMGGQWQVYVDLIYNNTVCDTTHYFALNPGS